MMVSCNSKPIDLHVMTFNIRYDNPGDSLNSWAYRKDIAAEVISQNNIDLLGTQEVLAHQLKDLETRLPGYKALGVGREDGKEKGEYCAILYKKDRFDEIKSGHFWLSETPEVAGSKGWDGACERIATWVVLKDKESKKELFFINTHLDHIGKAARREGVALLLNRAKETGKGLPVIITGDFNAEPESDVIKHVLENGAFSDSRLVSPVATGIAGTFNDFGRIPAEKRDYIDYIFVTKEFTVYSYEVLPEKKGETYYSDHAPVVAKMTLH
ncbi:MAG: endonuclease/exonuclease/phosphatase family protein [Tannerellaceae bacterium]|nr:endonuclease/exonuclease/phosphatase family protein [Tannerellaceae bacterium]